MKILLYSDLHISRTSSILPIGDDIKYTFRQKMIIETGKYLANLADEEKVDLIINLGDTFDQHTVTSYDVDTASEFFECFRYINKPHLVLVGNHEMINQQFNAIKLAGNINNITVINTPCIIDTKTCLISEESIDLAFLPYCDYKDIFDFPKGNFLFSHQDIQGSSIRGDFKLPDGINPNDLKSFYKLVFNGHIHKPSIEGNIINVGSITTHSFSDDEDSVPQCYIFDTNTLDLRIFKPTICPLFRRVDIETIEDLKSFISNLDQKYKYILHTVSPFEIKNEVKTLIEEKYKDLILTFRLNVKIEKVIDRNDENQESINLQSNIDIKQTFLDFLNTVDLKFSKSLYEEVLGGIKDVG